jgi:purine-binding chemotaxis protein CheW
METNKGLGSGLGNLGNDDFDDEEDTQKDRYLTFQLGEEDYGIEIQHVIEIVGMQHIASVPDMPEFVKGVINLRGQVIPVMDVRTRFGMPFREYDERSCIVVVKIGDSSVGLVVDTVREVLDIPEQNVSEPPRVARADSARYIKGIGKMGDDVKILINGEKLLFEHEQAAIGAAPQG